MDGGEEVACSLVVSGCNSSELLQPGEEVLDQMPSFVEMSIKVARRLAVGFRRDDHVLAGFGQRLNHPLVGIKRLVGNQSVSFHLGQQVVGADEVVRLPAGQVEADRVAESIDKRMDLGAQAAAGAADGLVFAGFFWAPALC
jgi:hypothetical protein